MKIIITGALGHIGSRIIRELPAYLNDLEIVMVDDLKTQRYSSLFELPQEAVYHFIQGDVTEMDLKPLFSQADAVIHLAALTDAAASFDHPEEMERVNFKATEQVALACADTGVPLIHASSTSVYGSEKDIIDDRCCDEDINPQSPYAEVKRKEEILVQNLVNTSDLRAMSFRFGTIFGTSPGMRFHTAVNKFCWQASLGLPLTVWETAYEQKRPYLDLSDAVKGLAFVLREGLFDGNIYNLVTVNATVKDVIDCIRSGVSNVTIDFVKNRIMNQLSYDVINGRLMEKGFDVQGSLSSAVQETLLLLKNAHHQK